jgi:hypothetical protein
VVPTPEPRRRVDDQQRAAWDSRFQRDSSH